MSSRTIAGIRIPDPAMVDLLEKAEAQGFRVEPAANGHGLGKKQVGLVVYPPDPEHAPIRFGCVEVNKNHVANVRSNLRAAGFIDDTQEAPVTKPAPKTYDEQCDALQLAIREFVNTKGGPDFSVRTGFVMSTAAAEAGLRDYEQTLLAGAFHGFIGAASSPAYAAEVQAANRAEAHARDDVQEALRLAEEAERERDAARKAAEKADEKVAQARKDCGDALARATAAEAERDELRKVIEPLKAFLGQK